MRAPTQITISGGEAKPTVAEAIDAISGLTGDAANVAALVAACLNAEAAFRMMGLKLPKRRGGFLPAGVLTLVEINALLEKMPEEVALVKASMAFACEYCGRPAHSGDDDIWICDECLDEANASTGYA